MRMNPPDRRDTSLDRIVAIGLKADRTRLGHAVRDGDLAHVHLLNYTLHYRDRARRAGHDAGTEAGKIEAIELRMIELGDEHGGHAVQRCALLGLNRFQYRKRLEAGTRINR